MEPRMGKLFASIFNKAEDIDAERSVSDDDVLLLAERLVILCSIHETQKRGRGKKQNHEKVPNHEKVNRYRDRTAQRVYLTVLKECPDIFIAFILVVSPRYCIEFDLRTFRKQHKAKAKPIALFNDCESIFRRIAIEHSLEKSETFQILIKQLFTLPRPSTEAEGTEKCSLSLCSLPATRIAFGDIIGDAVECSPAHLPMNADSDYAETTHCVRTTVFLNHEDTIIHIDVGCALKLAEMIFPSSSQKIAFAISQLSASHESPITDIGCLLIGSIYLAYFTLRGASIAGIRSAFSDYIYEAIEDSQLRRWEKHHMLSAVTDCITMRIWRAEVQRGLIILRIGHYTGVNLANKLYAEPLPDTAS
ncbi:uncharacterized protein N7484_008173 [Penicillium longicatenatum]|uniref:uncharacterized protein n=1 Tax=Penicillium longicatenatum TaxID=1561947 RepID=UPI0025467115|nr:uncharacterized protein N7484_008173 [Penicillium longicatenatum]KAJ5640311.1 hypothetical protein N7484_008173 [Penicillium longicatenatum]